MKQAGLCTEAVILGMKPRGQISGNAASPRQTWSQTTCYDNLS